MSPVSVVEGQHYLALVLDQSTIEEIQRQFPPQFPIVLCHHITIQYRIEKQQLDHLQWFVDCAPEFFAKRLIRVKGLELLELSCTQIRDSDTTVKRPFGGYYHITLSRDNKFSSSDSVEILDYVHNYRNWETRDERHQQFLDRFGVLTFVYLDWQNHPLLIDGEFQLVPYRPKSW